MIPTPPGSEILDSWYPILFAIGCGILYAFRSHFRGPQFQGNVDLKDKVVIVTGANGGIGYHTVKEFAKRGARVILACRNTELGEAAAEEIKVRIKNNNLAIKVMKLDLASLASIKQFAEDFQKDTDRLDILVNNAGIMLHPEAKSDDGFELHLAVNFIGPFYLTHLLLDLLKKSGPSRVINMTAISYQLGKINFEDIQFEKEYNASDAYSQSKLANLMFTRQLAKYLEGTEVRTYAVHPGVVNTDAHRHLAFKKNKMLTFAFLPFIWFFMKHASDGAQTVLFCALSDTVKDSSGKFFRDNQEREVDEHAKDDKVAKKLWNLAMGWTELELKELPSKKED